MSRGLKLVVGVLLVLLGAVWILQGLDVVHGSGMSGHGIWSVIGAVVAVLGAVLLVRTVRSPVESDDL